MIVPTGRILQNKHSNNTKNSPTTSIFPTNHDSHLSSKMTHSPYANDNNYKETQSPSLSYPVSLPRCKHNNILQHYIQLSKYYHCHEPNAGILTSLKYPNHSIRTSLPFHDIDMLPLIDLLLQHCNNNLSHIHQLDFRVKYKKQGFTSHGAIGIRELLIKSKYITELLINGNPIGGYGACKIFEGCWNNSNIRVIGMRGCLIHERGGVGFAKLLKGIHESKTSYNSDNNNDKFCRCLELNKVDLSVNRMGFKGYKEIQLAWNEHHLLQDDSGRNSMNINLDGNLVLQEILNGVTHGLGTILGIVGAIVLSNQVKEESWVNRVSCAIYSASLLLLYTSSTLYHSFFALRTTRSIFAIFDLCAIYILIAGSYTPFLQIALYDYPFASVYLFRFIWICAFCGISVEAFSKKWRYKQKFSLVMYLVLGWSCMVCMPSMVQTMPYDALKLIVLGGIAYTAGVPFFVRNNNLDHMIWHCFVLMGSFFHWWSIYNYIAPMNVSLV